MQLNDETRRRIESTLQAHRVVLFMKGTREQPQCGFSAATISILDKLVADYATVNVLEDQEIREAIKAYADWPTIPQLYVDQEFLGGCDLVREMFNTGALHQTLGLEPPDRTPPEITITDSAAEVMRNALASQPGVAVHLDIDAGWNHNFNLGPAEGHEVRAQSNGVELLMDLETARRARGLTVDMGETMQGRGFRIDNPNQPPPVKPMSVHELKRRLDAGEALHLFDVRTADERERARIEGSRSLDADAAVAIGGMPKDAVLVFYCHLGPRSLAAAEHFRLQGFTAVHNVEGGIDAWSVEIDPGVPRY